MSVKVGLGHSENDLEIQGEIDFDFFDSRPRSPRIHLEAKEGPEFKNLTENDLQGEIQEEKDAEMVNSLPSTSKTANKTDSYPKTKSLKQNKYTTLEQSVLLQNSKHSRKIIKTNVVIPRLESENENMSSEKKSSVLTEQRSLSNDSIFMDISKADEASSSGGTSSQSSSISMSDLDEESSISEDSIEGLTDSESITDVTPLHSPYFCDSPRPQSTCGKLIEKQKRSKMLLTKSQDKEMDYSEDSASNLESFPRKKKDNVRFEDDNLVETTSTNQSDGPIDLNVLVAAIKKLEVQQNQFLNVSKSRNCSTPPIGAHSRPLLHRVTANKTRKNMSFSNDEVRRIDQENQRLLKKIVTQQTRQKSKPGFASNSTLQSRGLYTPSSQVNRRRRQRQIEIENVAILRRIEAAKPSLELTRSHLLRDYNRLVTGSPSFGCVSSSRPSSSSQSISARNPGRHFSRSFSLSSLPTSAESNGSLGLLKGRKKLDSAPAESRQRNSQ